MVDRGRVERGGLGVVLARFSGDEPRAVDIVAVETGVAEAVGPVDIEVFEFALQEEVLLLRRKLQPRFIPMTGVDVAGVDQLGAVDAQFRVLLRPITLLVIAVAPVAPGPEASAGRSI